MLFLLAGHATTTNERLVDAFRRRGAEARQLDPRGMARGVVGQSDTVLVRLDVRPTLDGVEAGIEELVKAVRSGAEVLNPPAALFACHDKLQTTLRLARFGIPHPKTALVDATTPVPPLRFPVVVKPRFGSWGRDVHVCRTADELRSCLRGLARRAWFRRQGALVQELVPPLGYDLRVLVCAGEVVGAVERVARRGDWKTNVALGGRRRACEPSREASELALRAAAAVGADLVGVDLLPLADGGWVVLELNGAVDFTEEYSLAGEHVFDEVARLLVPASQPIFSFAYENGRRCASWSSTTRPLFGTP